MRSKNRRWPNRPNVKVYVNCHTPLGRTVGNLPDENGRVGRNLLNPNRSLENGAFTISNDRH